MFFRKKKPKAREGILTFLFINIRNYVGLSENVTPEQLIEFLRYYIDTCDQKIINHGGQITRIEADRILAVWHKNNSSKIVERKCGLCAIELVQELSGTNFLEVNSCFKNFAVLLSISRGECIYVKDKSEIVEVIGDAAIRVEKMNGEEYHKNNNILIDKSFKSACHDFKYIDIPSVTDAFFLEF